MSWDLWWAYFFACWVIALSPGSGAVLAMSHGLSYGVRRASVTIAGLQVGLLITLVVAGAGLGAVLVASETAFTVVKFAGAGYLLWLGLQQWRAGDRVAAGAVALAPMPARQRFVTGVLTNATNPKGILFMVAVLPQFIDPAQPMALQLLVLGLTTCAVDIVVMHGYALLAQRMQALFRSPSAARWQNRFLGGLLMAVGATLAFVKRAAP